MLIVLIKIKKKGSWEVSAIPNSSQTRMGLLVFVFDYQQLTG